MEFNKYNTSLEDLKVDNCCDEIKDQFYDAINNIPYIKRLIDKNLPKASDLPRDNDGKIIVDITTPHALEDMDYFRPSALHYKEHGCYTKLRPNANPNSEFYKWISEERRRCLEGYVRESDGEWITGDYYFFLNYCPIQLISKGKNGKSNRTVDFPHVWDGHYYKTHYLYKCREAGKHGMELASRGKGKAHPYSQHVYTPFGLKRWGDIQPGDYLFGDNGVPTRVVAVPYDEESDIYKVTFRDGRTIQCTDGHLFLVKDHKKKKMLVKSLSEIMEDYKNPRKKSNKNPRGYEYNYRVPKMSASAYYPTTRVEVDPYTLGLLIGDGCFRVVGARNYILFTCAKDDYYTYEENVPYRITKISSDNYTYKVDCSTDYLRRVGLYGLKSEFKFIPKDYIFNSEEIRKEVLRGLMDSDGTVDKTSGIPVFNTTSERLKDDVMLLCRSLGYNVSCSIHKSGYNGKICIPHYRIRIVTNDKIFKLHRKQKLVNKFENGYSKSTRDYTAIVNIEYSHKEMAKCVTVDNESHCYMVGDFVVTHNSFVGASLLAKRFILGESEDVNKKVQCVVTASEKKYIQGANQILDMFQYYIDFIANNMEWPSRRITSSLQNLQWTMGYIDLDSNTRKGTQNSVMGITSKDDESKLRGSRGVLYLLEEAGCHIKGTEVLMYDNTKKRVEDIKIGDLLMGDDNTPREVLECHNGIDDLYKITLSNGDFQIVNSNHIVPYYLYDYGKNKKESLKKATIKELLNKNIDSRYKIRKAIINNNYKEIIIDPYLLGLWLGDGDSTRVSIANEDVEVLEWLSNNYNGNIRDLNQSTTCKVFHISTKEKHIYDCFKHYDLFNNKHIPKDYINNSKEVILQLVAGLIDTDGTLDKRRHIYEITQLEKRAHILYDLKYMLESIGFKCSISTRINNAKSKGAGNLNYRLRISGDIQKIPVKINRKKDLGKTHYRNKRIWNDYTFNIEYYGKGEYYGFTVNKNHLFVLGDLTITHNSFPRLLNLYSVLRPSVEDGNETYGLIFGYGTSGDSESDFSSMQELMYNGKGYNIYTVNNVYDKEGQGRSNFTYFFPGYLNRANCYDENGNSNVTKALLEILKDRYMVKYNSTDINAITKRIAEIPITPQEAILRTKGNIFPVTQLNERLNEIDNDPAFFDNVYVGELVQKSDGVVEFNPTNDIPIRDFPTKDNKVAGAIEIYEMPQKINDKIPQDRYILSLDNYENDSANTMSLGSLFVLDLWTDRIVAEYTGRPMFSDDLNEIARKMCLFYNGKLLYENNKRNTFAYFSKMNSLYLLEDTPEYLLQKDLVKARGYGNASKGVTATVPIKNHGFTLIRDWLLKPNIIIIKDDGGEHETTVPNIHFIKNRALLKELILFNPVINVDRVMSLVQLMIFRESKMIMYAGNPTRSKDTPDDYIGNDSFFNNNYKTN